MSHSTSTPPENAVTRPASYRRTIVFAVVALSASAGITHFLSTRTAEQFAGELQAETIDLAAPEPGTVEVVSVKSGQVVYPDETLFIIRSSSYTDLVAQAQAKVDSLQAELRTAEARFELELAQIFSDMDAEVHAVEDELARLEGKRFELEFQDTAYSDFLGALSEPVASTDTTDLMQLLTDVPNPALRLKAMVERGRIENELDTQEARIELCESRLKRLGSARKQIPEKLRAAMGVPEVESRLAAAKTRLKDARNGDSTLTVASSNYGMAGLVKVSEHDEVEQYQTLLQVFDRGRESVRVLLPSRLISDISVDQDVALTFPGNETRSGRIDTIPPQVTEPSADGQEAVIAVTIRPVGRTWPTLPIGTTVNVSLK